MSNRTLIAGNSLVSFAPGLEARDQEDIANSIALAELCADKRFNRFRQIKDWYEAFLDKLIDVGWEMDHELLDAEIPEKKVFFDLEEAVLHHLQGIKQASLRKVLKESIEALRLDSVAQNIFETRNREGTFAYYQFVPCETRHELGSYIYLTAMQVTTRLDVENILFEGRTIRKTDALDVGIGWSAFYLDRKDYDRFRDDVLSQLEDLRADFFRLLRH
ncbi:hypothetical protein AQS70_18875 [Pseudomonas endophytica]|uniref:Uncharacterized protein n=1 Tax=Pseudomonas endophytica TaxID=1563157 RepID=A0A0N8VT77_9PSED|nr:hypothetical protein [Pseudomonas endophytica]KQB55356.1 hypothetical protein AQS70_18875 [Pseudomonas endophytica]